MQRKTLLSILVACLVLTASLAPSLTASAAESDVLGVEPTTLIEGQNRPVFVFYVQPGGAVRDSLSLTNKTDRDVTVDLYPADAVTTTDGGFALRKSDEEMDGVGAWVALPLEQVTIPPQAEVRVPFEMTVPGDITPGDHIGGIVALDVAERTFDSEGDVDFGVRTGVGARIYTRVDGPLTPQLAVSEVRIDKAGGLPALLGLPTDASVTYTVTNTGNVRLSSTAVLSADPTLGSATIFPEEPLPELLPGSSVTVTRPLGSQSSIGEINVTVAVTALDVTPVVAMGTSTLFTIPWLLIAIWVLLVVLFVRFLRRRRARRGGIAAPPAPDGKALVGS